MGVTDEEKGRVVTVSQKGQATIPKPLRDAHGITTPGKVRIRENDAGEIVVEPLPGLSSFRGAAETDRAGTDLLAESRATDRERDRRLTGE
ncbi:MAG: AbrB/MazE/SpoVT family DNA-binding domain-containing protein [Halococcoides sp.]